MRIIKRKYVTLHVERHLSYGIIINLKKLIFKFGKVIIKFIYLKKYNIINI